MRAEESGGEGRQDAEEEDKRRGRAAERQIKKS